MGTTFADLQARISVDNSDAKRGMADFRGEMDRTGDAGERAGDRVSGKRGLLGGIASMGGVLVAGAGAVMGMGAAFKGMVGNASEAQQVFSQTEAVIKSMGGASGLTAQEVADLASSMSAAAGKSKFGDEEILAGQNLLLTFRNLSKDVFPEVSQAMVNMAQAMGTDTKSAAMQLGKALNDPAEGLQKLQRVGITFTAEQKALIESLQAAGDMAGAQRVMLEELENQFGGSALAAAQTFDGQMTTLKDTFGELLEAAGARLLPMLQKLVGWLASPEVMGTITALANSLIDGIGAGITFVGNAFSTVQTLMQPVLDVLGTLGTIFMDMVTHGESVGAVWQNMPVWLQPIAGIVAEIGEKFNLAIGFVQAFVNFVANAFGGKELLGIEEFFEGILPPELQEGINALGGVLAQIPGFVQSAFTTLGGIFAGLWPQIQGVFGQIVAGAQERLGAVLGIFQSVWGIIAGFLQQNGASIVSSVQGWLTQLVGFIGPILSGAQTIFMTVFGAIQSFLSQHSAEIQGVLTMAWQTIQTVIDGAMVVIQNVVIPIFSAIATFIQEHGDTIATILGNAWNVISSLVQGAMNVIQGIINTVTSLIKGDWEGAWAGIQQIFTGIWDGITGALRGAMDLVGSIIGLGLDALKGVWEFIWGKIGGFLTDTWNNITSGIRTGIDNVIQFFKDLPGNIWNLVLEVGRSVIDGIIEGLKSAGNAVKDFLLGLITGAVDAVKSFFGISSPSKLMAYFGRMTGLGFAYGIGSTQKDVLGAMTGLSSAVLRGVGAMGTPTIGMRVGAARGAAGLGAMAGVGVGRQTAGRVYNIGTIGLATPPRAVRTWLEAVAERDHTLNRGVDFNA